MGCLNSKAPKLIKQKLKHKENDLHAFHVYFILLLWVLIVLNFGRAQMVFWNPCGDTFVIHILMLLSGFNMSELIQLACQMYVKKTKPERKKQTCMVF